MTDALGEPRLDVPEASSAEVASPALGRGTPLAAGRLAELSVRNLALIERLTISFEPGLNVLTGETGAGKSLLIDALGLAIGARADTSLVRHGSEQARVEALFDRLPEPLICVREVTAGGRSTARVDDEAATAARLADVAGRRVEIHGQHDQQRLLDERWQRELLDAFGNLERERAAMTAAAQAWRRRYDVGRAQERTCGLGGAAAAALGTAFLRAWDAGWRRHNLGRKSANAGSCE